MPEVNESITTVEDGPTSVNERLSQGGPGPEGQPDTVVESLSGRAALEPTETPVKAAPRKVAARKSAKA